MTTASPSMSGTLRCPHCNKKLGERLGGTYQTLCPRCKTWLQFRTELREEGCVLLVKSIIPAGKSPRSRSIA